MNFSVNQVRHLYVANVVGTVNDDAKAGTIKPVVNDANNTMYFQYKSPGGVMRSDLIDIATAKYVKRTPAEKLQPALKKATIKVDGDLLVGKDYILRIVIRQFAGMSDEDTYIKYGVVHTASTDKSTFYKQLAVSLAKNFSRELTPLFKFKVGNTEVTPLTKISDIAGEATELVIEEVEQDWIKGTKASVPVYFDVIPVPVEDKGAEINWAATNDEGKVEIVDGTKLTNGKKIADLEYFCMGERGDIYRNVGWPNVIPTKYLVDETKDYDVLDIHYYYEGAGENPQKSEKDITIVAEEEVMNTLVTALTEAGLTVQVAGE